MKVPSSAIFLLFVLASVACEPAQEQVAVEEADTGSISAGKFNLDYFIEGTGTPTIVIGFPNYYRRVFSQNLRSHLRLVFLDHRSSAPSPGPVGTEEFALERLIDDIELARQTLELGRIAVIGHSGNSYMALEYGKKYPEHTSHVVMIGIAPDLSEASDELAAAEYEKLADADRLAAEQENIRALPDEELESLPPDEAFVRGYVRNAARVWYDPRFDCTPLFKDVTFPRRGARCDFPEDLLLGPAENAP